MRFMTRSLLLPLPFILVACDDAGQSAAPASPPPAVLVSDVRQVPVQLRTTFVGRTEAKRRVELRARVQGFLKAVDFQEGGAVETDDSLFSIEPDRYQAQVQQARAKIAADEAQLTDARLKRKRYEKLRASRSVSQQDLDATVAAEQAARAAVDASKAALKLTELDLAYTTIRAPFSGQIGKSAYDVGNLVGPDAGVMATIVDLDEVLVRFTVSDVEYLDYRRRVAERANQGIDRPDREARPHLLLADGMRYPHPGRFAFIDNEIDPGTGTLALRASFPNPEHLLRPGQFVTVELEQLDAEQALVVPQSAVQTSQAGHSALVVNAESLVEQRAIKLGESWGDQWIVLDGLDAGEQVIVEGLQKARAGQTVTASPLSPPD